MMAAPTAARAPAATATHDAPSYRPGFAFDFGAYRFEPQDRNAVMSLVIALRTACGSVDGETREVRTNRAAWRTLRELPASVVLEVVGRVERGFPPWRLASSDDLAPADAIDALFKRARKAP